MIWKPVYVDNKCVGIGVVDGSAFSEIICSTILPDNDEEYSQQKNKIESRMGLMAGSLEMREALELIASGLSEKGPRQIADEILKKVPCIQE